MNRSMQFATNASRPAAVLAAEEKPAAPASEISSQIGMKLLQLLERAKIALKRPGIRRGATYARNHGLIVSI